MGTTEINCQECTCRGKSWYCTGRFCHQMCSVYGEGHFESFDGKHFSFNGQCNYIMAQTKDVTVLVDMQPCGTNGVTCAKGVKIINNHKKKASVTMNKDKCAE